jgi:hypothetical protein
MWLAPRPLDEATRAWDGMWLAAVLPWQAAVRIVYIIVE